MGTITALLLVMFTVVLSLRQRPKLPAWTKPVEQPSTRLSTCSNVMRVAKIDFDFANAIAHRAHSLTLEDVEYYFKSDTLNPIPTVNPDLTVANQTRVLLHAPKDGYDREFETIALRHTDKVLSKMNRKDWEVKYYSTLEKLVHTHHMAELWSRSMKHYEKYTQDGLSEELCTCLRDVENNGVLAELQLMALKIKYPGITSGEFDLGRLNRGLYYSLSYRLSYTLTFSLQFSKKDQEKLKELMKFREKVRNFDFSGDEEDVVRRVARELIDGDKGLEVHLTSEEGWSKWKDGFHNMGKDVTGDRTFGMFMYCMLNGEQ